MEGYRLVSERSPDATRSVDGRLHLEAESDGDQENRVLDHRVHGIFKGIGHVGMLDADNPVMVGSFRLFVYYGIQQFAFHHILCRRKADIHHIRRIAGYFVIVPYRSDYVYVIGEIFIIHVEPREGAPFVPDKHYAEQAAGYQNRKPAAMYELEHIGGEKGSFQQAEHNEKRVGQQCRKLRCPLTFPV